MINIYKASAGSGKTFTLAREYIKLLLGRKDESADTICANLQADHTDPCWPSRLPTRPQRK